MFCVVAQEDIKLVDRPLRLGDTVKKKFSDPQSGTVIGTSVTCAMRPVQCNPDRKSLVSSGNQGPIRLPRGRTTPICGVYADDLRYCNQYQDGDFIIYDGWIGVVEAVTHKVKVRMGKNNIVAVKDYSKLRRPDLTSTRQGRTCHRNLLSAGYSRCESYPDGEGDPTLKTRLLQHCFPGQLVEVDLSNLHSTSQTSSEDSWSSNSAESTSTEPLLTAIVYNVDCIGLDVQWICSNVFRGSRNREQTPPCWLYGEILAGDQIKRYDIDQLPQRSAHQTQARTSKFRNGVLGQCVRFRNPEVALKYDGKHLRPDGKPFGTFERIPCALTDGFDMNVFIVLETQCEAFVHWQDDTISREDSKSLVPYRKAEDLDCYPGHVVQLQDAARLLNQGQQEYGVVQSVNARRKMAWVRWFDRKEVLDEAEEGRSITKMLALGPISNRTTLTSLYDIEVLDLSHPHRLDKGDLGIIVPSRLPPLHKILRPWQPPEFQAYLRIISRLHELPPREATSAASDEVDWFGEILNVDTDGGVTVRLGVLAEVRHIRVAIDRVVIVSSRFNKRERGFPQEIQGIPTIDEAVLEPIEDAVAPGGTFIPGGDHENCLKVPDVNSAGWRIDRAGDSCTRADRPSGFRILDEPPPNDHAFYLNATTLTGAMMRRIRQEHFFLQEVLPERMFVRTWADRLDMLRVLLVGAVDTPYEHAPFVFDVHLRPGFPAVQPDTYFHSWADNNQRVHPNLCSNGEILGSWPKNGGNDGHWSAHASSLRQLFVCVLAFVSTPEPHYDLFDMRVFRGSDITHFVSQHHVELAFVRCKDFIQHAIGKPPGGFDDIVQWLYFSSQRGPNLLGVTIGRCRALVMSEESSQEMDMVGARLPGPSRSPTRLSAGAIILLERALVRLEHMAKSH